ncbi:MAG: alpha/beta hydrolase, partial [Anaerolineae bacterium]|nr:alpha/beta hydrolase [Anaerolineae bacterium]
IGLLLFVASWHFTNVLIYPETFSIEETYNTEIENGWVREDGYLSWPKEEITLRSPYGYKLFGIYLPVEGAKKTVICVHGITWTLYGSIQYINMFRSRGFNVLIIDNRNHGHSEGNTTSYGYYEKHDLKAWVNWVMQRCGEDCIVGTHGVSMGAAIVLQHLAIDNRINFCIADCPYASIYEEAAYRLKIEHHLPPSLIMPLTNLLTKLRMRYYLSDAAPIKVIDQINTPVFFIHGKDDDYIPPEASIQLYEAKPGAKKLYLSPNAIHAESHMKNQAEYETFVGEFLQEVGVI